MADPATPPTTPTKTVGSVLREARQAKKLTIEIVSAKTKIPTDHIMWLEDNIIEADASYIKQCVVSLCKLYDLESKDVLSLNPTLDIAEKIEIKAKAAVKAAEAKAEAAIEAAKLEAEAAIEAAKAAGRKWILAFGVLLVLHIGISIYAFLAISRANNNYKSVEAEAKTAIEAAKAEVATEVAEAKVKIAEAARLEAETQVKADIEAIKADMIETKANLDKLEAAKIAAEAKAKAAEAKAEAAETEAKAAIEATETKAEAAIKAAETKAEAAIEAANAKAEAAVKAADAKAKIVITPPPVVVEAPKATITPLPQTPAANQQWSNTAVQFRVAKHRIKTEDGKVHYVEVLKDINGGILGEEHAEPNEVPTGFVLVKAEVNAGVAPDGKRLTTFVPLWVKMLSP